MEQAQPDPETILWIVNTTSKKYLLFDKLDNKITDIPKSIETKINLSSKWKKIDPTAQPSIYLNIPKNNVQKMILIFNIWTQRPDIHALGLTLFERSSNNERLLLGNELLPYDPAKGTANFQIRLVLKGEKLEKSYFDLTASQR